MKERSPDTCCAEFRAAMLAGTDNEGYMELIEWRQGWMMGSTLPAMRFCPWCGVKLKDI